MGEAGKGSHRPTRSNSKHTGSRDLSTEETTQLDALEGLLEETTARGVAQTVKEALPLKDKALFIQGMVDLAAKLKNEFGTNPEATELSVTILRNLKKYVEDAFSP